MERIAQSVAKLVVFRAFLASDGKTPGTGLTIAITMSKNGGAFGNLAAGATNATEISSGFYKFTLAAGDTDTVGPLAWRGAEGTINDAADIYSVCTDVAVAAAIKVQTDKFVFTVANEVNANVQSINDAALVGDGDGTPWGPA
jgi:hypothetical protein